MAASRIYPCRALQFWFFFGVGEGGDSVVRRPMGHGNLSGACPHGLGNAPGPRDCSHTHTKSCPLCRVGPLAQARTLGIGHFLSLGVQVNVCCSAMLENLVPWAVLGSFGDNKSTVRIDDAVMYSQSAVLQNS